MGTLSFPAVKSGRGVGLTPHPLLVPRSRKSRAIPVLPLWAVGPVQSLTAYTEPYCLYKGAIYLLLSPPISLFLQISLPKYCIISLPTCFSHLTLLDYITRKIFGEMRKFTELHILRFLTVSSCFLCARSNVFHKTVLLRTSA